MLQRISACMVSEGASGVRGIDAGEKRGAGSSRDNEERSGEGEQAKQGARAARAARLVSVLHEDLQAASNEGSAQSDHTMLSRR